MQPKEESDAPELEAWPQGVQAALASILCASLLSIRAAASSGDTDFCFAAADHAHNLPNLICTPDIEALRYYWTTERRAYLAHLTNGRDTTMEEAWAVLASFLGEGDGTEKAP